MGIEYNLGYEEASGAFLESLNRKLEEMGVLESYSDSDLKDAVYGMVKDAIAEIEEAKRETVKDTAGLQMAEDIVKKHFGF